RTPAGRKNTRRPRDKPRDPGEAVVSRRDIPPADSREAIQAVVHEPERTSCHLIHDRRQPRPLRSPGAGAAEDVEAGGCPKESEVSNHSSDDASVVGHVRIAAMSAQL